MEFSKSPFGIGCETLDRKLWDPKEIYPWMEDLPVKWARLQTGWARVERVKGVYDWEWLDESVDGLLIRGFKPFFNVGYGNPNYNEGDAAIGFHPLVDDETYEAWKEFVKALSIRYKDKIQHYEIWNEPNLSHFWKPGKVDPGQYVRLVKGTAPIIRENCPGAIIVGGSLGGIPLGFTRSLFEHGLGKEIDIFSFHPYSVIPEGWVHAIKALRKLIDRYNPDIKIWQGETGYPSEPESTGYTGEPPWTENIQAKHMLRRLITDLSLNLDMTLWFLIVDIHDYPKGSGRTNHKGILRVKPQVEHKVAFKVLQNLGSTIYGDVSLRNAVIRFSESGKYPMEEATMLLRGNRILKNVHDVYSTMLNSGGGKVLAYWKTVKAEDIYEEENTDLFLWDWEENGFDEPVLLDLMSGNIYDLNTSSTRIRDAQTFQQLPLHDYPMLIVEKRMAKG